MTSKSIVSRLLAYLKLQQQQRQWLHQRPLLHSLVQQPQELPLFVQASPVAYRYLKLLGLLDWSCFPERDLETQWGIPALPLRPFVAAYLVKLDQHFEYMSQLRTYLIEHPALLWVLGFPLVSSRAYPWGFDAAASLPTQRHFSRVLRKLSNASLQMLLAQTVVEIQAALSQVTTDFGQTISLDTKHILAWVKENNPKAYVRDRYAKEKQPSGDPDCRLGCKRKRNQYSKSDPAIETELANVTPLTNPRPATGCQVSEYHWGYASGIIVTKVSDWGEFVLAELTQPFNQADVSYFFPLLTVTEQRLGFRPRFAALDAAFDAFYIYAYFHRLGEPWQTAFAAIPWAKRGPWRSFNADGLPLCAAELPMPCKSTFINRSSRVVHERGRYVCPLLFPEKQATACPVNSKKWTTGGCHITMPTSIGARLRFQIDRESTLYQEVYKQRTATERINSQAKALGIERPRLRNQQAITNQNTLIYVLINLRALHRIHAKKLSDKTQ